MSRVPRIRFKGFKEDWEQRKLGEVFEEYSEKNHSELPPLTIIQGGGTIRRDESDRALQYDRDSLSNYKMVNKDDFIVHLRSFEGGLEKANTTGIISPAYHTFSGENTDTTFYYTYFRSKKFIETDLKPHVYGIRDGRSIDIEGMKSINIPYTIFEEQSRIGKFIDLIDHLITLHQRKLEKLKIIKKSMLENLFPQNGEKTPKIRFSGFTEDWEQRKLGEVCNIITKQTGFDYSNTIKPALLKEEVDNTYPFIQNKDFNGTTINMDTDFFIPVSIAERFPNIVLDRPSLLISISGRIGNVGFYNGVLKAFIGGAVGICKLKYDDDGKFVVHELESDYAQKYFHLLIKASSHANITVEDIRNMELIFPNKKEEKVYISTFFSTLDHLITLHQSKLDKLQKIKKSMLESMFA